MRIAYPAGSFQYNIPIVIDAGLLAVAADRGKLKQDPISEAQSVPGNITKLQHVFPMGYCFHKGCSLLTHHDCIGHIRLKRGAVLSENLS